MTFIDLQKRALEIREKYRILEIKKEGVEWSNEKLTKGFLKDVSDLLQLIKNKSDVEEISHELSDCLWSILVISKNFNINPEQSFLENMNKLEERINRELKNYKD